MFLFPFPCPKIESEEYEEALTLAQTYGLDTDLVYQRQWRKSVVNIASIQNYLVCIFGDMVKFKCMEHCFGYRACIGAFYIADMSKAKVCFIQPRDVLLSGCIDFVAGLWC